MNPTRGSGERRLRKFTGRVIVDLGKEVPGTQFLTDRVRSPLPYPTRDLTREGSPDPWVVLNYDEHFSRYTRNGAWWGEQRKEVGAIGPRRCFEGGKQEYRATAVLTVQPKYEYPRCDAML